MSLNDHLSNHKTLVVLAGGVGRRMGGCDKCLKEYAGIPLYKYVVKSAENYVDDTILVGNFYHSPTDDIKRIHDIEPAQGPLSGLNTLANQCVEGTFLISACDMPNLTSAVWQRLLENYTGDFPVYAKTDASHYHLVVVCNSEHIKTANILYLEGCRKPKEWLLATDAKSIDMNDLSDCFTNLNAIS